MTLEEINNGLKKIEDKYYGKMEMEKGRAYFGGKRQNFPDGMYLIGYEDYHFLIDNLNKLQDFFALKGRQRKML